MTKIGDYIKNARIEKGYTIRKLAKLSGVNYSLLSKIEAGKTQNPHLRFIKALCRYLDITYGDCLYIMGLGASYNPNNKFLIAHFENLDINILKQTYLNTMGAIKANNRILHYLKGQYDKTDKKDLLIDTIKSYEYENQTNYVIREILEEKIIKEYLKN